MNNSLSYGSYTVQENGFGNDEPSLNNESMRSTSYNKYHMKEIAIIID
jgi:hypothetical protein